MQVTFQPAPSERAPFLHRIRLGVGGQNLPLVFVHQLTIGAQQNIQTMGRGRHDESCPYKVIESKDLVLLLIDSIPRCATPVPPDAGQAHPL